jgi:hypothetical protein
MESNNPASIQGLEESNRLISLFNELIDSEECRSLQYQCLLDPVTKIIQNNIALDKMRNLDGLFDYVYETHFIKKINTFTLVSDPYNSMCMELVMRKWH